MTRLETLDISSRHDCVLSKVCVHSKGHLSSFKLIQVNRLRSENSIADNLYSMTRLQTLDISTSHDNVFLIVLRYFIKQAPCSVAIEAMPDTPTNITQSETLYIYTNEYNVLSKVLKNSSKHLSNVKRLSLSQLSTEEGEYLAESHPCMTQLDTLDISLSIEDNDALADSLHNITRIESLDISAGYDYLLSNKVMSSIKHLTNLEHLRLTCLDTKASKALADSLPTLMKIQTLDISSQHENILSKELMSSIKHLTNLRHLCFIGINHDASETLANNLYAIIRIQKMEIASSCDSLLSKELMFSIKHLTNLEHLRLTGLDREASKALAYNLPSLTRIQTLDLSSQPCTLSKKCVQSTTHLTQLKQLRLADLATDGMESLVAGLPNMTQLEKLEISINRGLFTVNEAFIDSLSVTNGTLSVKIKSYSGLLDDRVKQYITSKSRFQIVKHCNGSLILKA